MNHAVILHLRFPFSFFLLPVFLFALSVSEHVIWRDAVVTAFILHLLLYPSSNGYNSYFDKDEGSIGCLKAPPMVTKKLYYTSIFMDFTAILTSALFLSFTFTVMIFVYGLASKAYSHPTIRLKKYPVLGWITVFLFQGYFIFLASYLGITGYALIDIFRIEVQLPAVLSSILLAGSYPMTQIYQHEEDGNRGDKTISLVLGVPDTFHLTGMMFLAATGGFAYYFVTFESVETFIQFQLMMAPSLFYFLHWYRRVRIRRDAADYTSTMRLNLISSIMLNSFFLIQIFLPVIRVFFDI